MPDRDAAGPEARGELLRAGGDREGRMAVGQDRGDVAHGVERQPVREGVAEAHGGLRLAHGVGERPAAGHHDRSRRAGSGDRGEKGIEAGRAEKAAADLHHG